MRRRDFMLALGGAAVTWPLAAHGQQDGRVRRVGVLIPFMESESEWTPLLAAFKKRLNELGWTEGRNIRFEQRFSGGNPERIRAAAVELVATAPDVLYVVSNASLPAVKQATQKIPTVFTQVADPVGGGFVASLAHPGGNITGFQSFDPAIGGKWLGVLKEIKPDLRRAGYLLNPDIAANVAYFKAAEVVSGSLGMTAESTAVRRVDEIGPAIEAFARAPNGGLVVTPNPILIAAAARLRLPAIYPYAYFAKSGGLMSYGYDPMEQWLGASSYVDRILRGAKAGELPVQLATKYQMVINLKAANALGLKMPDKFLITADEVIE
jgi:putative ABC transport system substrate-binding protein